MNYITFDLKPCPCMSVKLKILPPDKLFRIFVVAYPTLGFLVLAETAIPINGAATLTAGFRNLFHAAWLPLNVFFIVFLKPAPSN